MTDLMEALEQNEPLNHALMYDVAQNREEKKKTPILQQTLVLVERAFKMDPANSAYLTE